MPRKDDRKPLPGFIMREKTFRERGKPEGKIASALWYFFTGDPSYHIDKARREQEELQWQRYFADRERREKRRERGSSNVLQDVSDSEDGEERRRSVKKVLEWSELNQDEGSTERPGPEDGGDDDERRGEPGRSLRSSHESSQRKGSGKERESRGHDSASGHRSSQQGGSHGRSGQHSASHHSNSRSHGSSRHGSRNHDEAKQRDSHSRRNSDKTASDDPDTRSRQGAGSRDKGKGIARDSDTVWMPADWIPVYRPENPMTLYPSASGYEYDVSIDSDGWEPFPARWPPSSGSGGAGRAPPPSDDDQVY